MAHIFDFDSEPRVCTTSISDELSCGKFSGYCSNDKGKKLGSFVYGDSYELQSELV